MKPEEAYQWRLSLEVKLRRAHGDALQDFFSTVMERRHKSDFVRVRPFGALGDKGCDGHLLSNGQFFQCYGKVGDASLNVATLIKKMDDDFEKAKTNFSSSMREWHFVHNLLDGVPSEVLSKLSELRTANPNCKFGVAAYEWFADTIFSLPQEDIVALLGPTATAELSLGLDIGVVKELLSAITNDIHEAPIDEGDPRPVPVDKLDFNELSSHWRFLIRAGSPNAPHVQRYFDRHQDPEFGKLVARAFKERYAALKEQSLSPDAIMTELYIQTAGNGVVPPMRQIAAQAILAHVFDSCDIFEDRPEAVAS